MNACCVFCFMETWLIPTIPNCALQADGYSIHLIARTESSANKQKLKRENPSQKVVQCWSEAAEERLWDCFELVAWAVFKCSVENLNQHATTVMDFISKCVKDCVPKKCTNRKSWMNQEIRLLLKTRHAAFRSDDPDLYRRSRYDLRKATREVKRQYRTKLEAQANHTDTRHLWQGLHNITGYKMKQSKIADKDTSLLDALNVFFAWFATGTMSPASTAPDTPVASVTPADVRLVFLGVNTRKAMGPDGIHGRALRTDRKKLQKVVCTGQTITEANLQSIDSLYTCHCRGKAVNIIKDSSHP
eukprot:g46883.t1